MANRVPMGGNSARAEGLPRSFQRCEVTDSPGRALGSWRSFVPVFSALTWKEREIPLFVTRYLSD
jgi:hypothetical protein